MRDIISILGVKIDKITLNGAAERVRGFLTDDKTRVIYTPNTEIVMEARKNSDFKELLNRADLIIPDGIGLIYASKIKKKTLPERVTGVDLSVKMLELADEHGYSLFILGGKDGIAKEATENISEKYPNIKIAGYHHGFFKGTHIGHKGHDEEKAVIEMINKTNSDMLFVGLGAPKQEIWINENKDLLNCKVIIGNGGTVDILSGRVKNTPEFYRKHGLEWLYRLAKNPKRIKRQMVLPLFALIVLFSKEDIVK
jgi:N-acetylglucosaminyldiphosphoundecaprenol N-acetyl-beta-D-mannosaminyltransferase